MKQFFRQYFYLLDTQAKRQLPLLLVLFLISSLLDVIGIGMIGVLLALIANPEHFSHYLPFVEGISPKARIYWVGTVIVAAFLLKGISGYWIQKRIAFFGYRYALRLKLKLLTSFLQAPYAYHLDQHTSTLINRVNQADIFVGNLLIPSMQICANLLIGVAIIGLLLVMHPWGTLSLAAVFGFIFWLNNSMLKKTVTRLGKIVASGGGEIMKSISNALGGLKEIRILGKERYFVNRLQVVADDYATALGASTAYQQIPRALIESLLAIFMVVLCLGTFASGMEPASIVSFVGVFAAAGARLLPTMNQLTAGINQMRFVGATMQKLYDDVHSLDQMALDENSLVGAIAEKAAFEIVELRDVDYHYTAAKQSALIQVSMRFKKGQSIGLMGTSGAGKSTLVNVLLGLLTPQSGAILVDGKPITNLRAWLNNFAYIPQQIFLLDDTFKHNIALGLADHEIDLVKLAKVIQMAQLQALIEHLPQGIDTLVGEQGVRLSGGQRQRVALARAFYFDRDIIVMDEATSALDNETEYEVIQAIKQLHGIKTLIVIAHRLTTIQYCDVVYKMEHGRVVAQGSYEEVVGK